jgi:hypothetical protein
MSQSDAVFTSVLLFACKGFVILRLTEKKERARRTKRALAQVITARLDAGPPPPVFRICSF